MAYFIFIGNALLRMLNPHMIASLLPANSSVVLYNFNNSAMNDTLLPNSTQTNVSLVVSNVTNTAYGKFILSLGSLLHYVQSCTCIFNVTGVTIQGQTNPRLELLILSPLPIFLVLSLIRHVRQLAFTSVVANGSLLIGFVVIVVYLSISKCLLYLYFKEKLL